MDLQVEIDPRVLGGVVVRVGDEVLDGSLARRLDRVRRELGGSAIAS
jgi:F-type H+-transporting ATPase subunit delta